jgi:dTDP-4-amino-4,6-dideoxygalactose transaminase
LISDYDCYRRQFDSSLTPVARRVASSVLTLPLYASLETEKIKQICGLIRALK